MNQYELQIQGDKKREKEFSQFGKVKVIEGGKISVNLKKKAFKKDGSDAAKVRVVDSGKKELDPTLIGNGSIGNVMIFIRPYEMMGKSGVSIMLVAVQVTKLIEYKATNGVDFDTVDETETSKEVMDSPF